MEGDIIFVYELDIGDVVGIFVCVLLVFLVIVGCIGLFLGCVDIVDWGIKLDIEDFGFEVFVWCVVFGDRYILF